MTAQGDHPSSDNSPVNSPVKSPYSKTDLKHFHALLVERRERILGSVNALENEALHAADQSVSVDHMADHGSDSFDQDVSLSIAESERQELVEIDDALVRIEHGSYGVCLGTGEAILRARLEAIPYTRYSIEHQRLIEEGVINPALEDS
jgi:RNA polymerase-binding transcription factor DksA